MFLIFLDFPGIFEFSEIFQNSFPFSICDDLARLKTWLNFGSAPHKIEHDRVWSGQR